jgi:cytochrome c oxidase subunit 1
MPRDFVQPQGRTPAYGAKLSLALMQASAFRGLHDTYYIVAHTHMFVQGASLFALFAGLNAAFPSIGRQVWLGIVQSVFMIIGAVMSFVPQTFLGLQGMPKRYMDYTEAFEFWNYISSLGSFVMTGAIALWSVILLRAWFGRRSAYV